MKGGEKEWTGKWIAGILKNGIVFFIERRKYYENRD